jgi:hypothetical protein
MKRERWALRREVFFRTGESKLESATGDWQRTLKLAFQCRFAVCSGVRLKGVRAGMDPAAVLHPTQAWQYCSAGKI